MNRRLALSIPFAALIVSTCIALPAMAQDTPSRLQRIKDTATIVISYQESAVPFSYVSQNGPVGFGIDISRKLAQAVKENLGLPELKIRWNPVTLSTRFPMITTNTVDLECLTTTNTLERQKMVSFSNTFYVSEEAIAVQRDSRFQSQADLRGARLAVVRGTTTEAALLSKGMNIVAESTNRRAMNALVEGRADAYVAAASIIAGETYRLDNAGVVRFLASEGSQEAFGCMLPKGDTAFKKVVDQALTGMMQSGELEAVYDKWFMEPIAPKNRTIGLPLNSASRALYRAPDDHPLN